MEDLKQQYLDKMKSLINEFSIKGYRDEKIDIKINELKENFNGMSIEINKKKKLQQLEQSDDYDSEGDDNSTSLPEFESFHVDYPDSGDSTIDVVEDIPVDMPNILPTHPTLHIDFDFIPSHNDLGSLLTVSF
ncbi:hypothetical protein Tco_0948909 [Tanacetum coccineum]